MDYEKEIQEIYIPEGFEATIEGDKIILKKTESEDEKIRKEMIKVFSNRKRYLIDQSFGDITVSEALAWLEKQGQKPRKVSIWKHWKDGICGNGEGKLIYLIKNGDDYSLSSSLGFECDYIELSDLDNLTLEKQGEQKPTDEDMKEALRTEYEKGRADAFAEMRKEWSEKDEEFLRRAINATKDVYPMTANWLKSIKQRYKWKPSDEQITVLELASKYERVFTPKQIDILIGLKEQLKKLKGQEV